MSVDFSRLCHPGIQTLSPYVPGKSISEVAKESGLTDIIKLASNENAMGCSPKVIEAIQDVLSPEIISRYPSAAHHPLHQQLSDYLDIEPNMLAIANGSDSLFGLLLVCFALGQNKFMLTHDYAFSSYAIQAHTLEIPVVSAPTKNFQIDIDALLAACTLNTALIFIANPNNPTGLSLDLQDIQSILDHIPPSTLLVLDEAYYEFLNPLPNTITLLKKYRNLVITRTFSKAYGLAGLRLGYAIADPQIIDLIKKIHLPFTTNTLAMYAASAALSDQTFLHQSIQFMQKNRELMAQQLQAIGVHALPSCTNFLTIDCKKSGAKVAQQLLASGIIVRPLNPYHMDHFIRVTIGTVEQNNRFLSAFHQIKDLL